MEDPRHNRGSGERTIHYEDPNKGKSYFWNKCSGCGKRILFGYKCDSCDRSDSGYSEYSSTSPWGG